MLELGQERRDALQERRHQKAADLGRWAFLPRGGGGVCCVSLTKNRFAIFRLEHLDTSFDSFRALV